MSAEFFVRFTNINWYSKNIDKIKEKVPELDTFSQIDGDAFWLSEDKLERGKNFCPYDVRIIFSNNPYILVEISAHPQKIEKDLTLLFNWLRRLTTISIEDEDGVVSNW